MTVAAPMLAIQPEDVVIRRGEDFPAEWLRRLREISPVTDRHSYLVPIWFRRTRFGGTAREEVLSGQCRWVLYQVQPRWSLDAGDVVALEAPHPNLTPKELRPAFPDAMQWEWYHGYYPGSVKGTLIVPFWVLQGEHGGHPCEYQPWQVKTLRVMGLPEKPPPVGMLPPCPFDERVVRAIQRQNRLIHLDGDMDRLRKSGSSEAMQQDMESNEREFRALYMGWLKEQMAEPADMLGWAMTKTESDRVLDKPDPADLRAAMDAEARFVETGSVALSH